jgi:hypothetical protein
MFGASVPKCTKLRMTGFRQWRGVASDIQKIYLRFKILLQQIYHVIDKVTEQAGAAEEL